MKPDEARLWWTLALAVACCVLLAYLIGVDRIISGSELVRDRLLLGSGR